MAGAVSQAGSWRERWARARNRIVGSADFQRWAGRFPLTRPIARVRSRRLFDLAAGFVWSQWLLAAVESGALEALSRGPAGVAEVAQQSGLSEPMAARMLHALAGLGLAEQVARGRWMLGAGGAELLGAPGVVEMIRHHATLYRDLAEPLALMRGERAEGMPGFWDYSAENSAAASAYSALMAASQPMVADQLLSAVDVRRWGSVLDVGGGEGAFLGRLANAAPTLRLGLFDLPAVTERARARAERLGFADRLRLFPGSFVHNELPRGFHVITLVRVLHDHDDPVVADLLARCRRALDSGGRLVILEPMSRPGGTADPYFGLYLLAMGRGRPRSPAEYTSMLAEAGFRSSRRLRSDLDTAGVVVAEA
jgi:demethylspheroidene O-methyltransferase